MMPLELDAVLDLLSTLADEEDLRIAVKGSLWGGLLTGAVATAGGLMLGPAGLAVGGAVGGMAAFSVARDKFESVGQIIVKMNKEQKQKLYDAAMTIINNFSIEDIVTLQSTISGDLVLRRQLLDRVVDHVHNQLEMQIVD